MTFEALAAIVADDFKAIMAADGFETFQDMKRSYGWDARDIKEEVESMIALHANSDYKAGGSGDYWMADDFSFVQIGVDDMSWGDFKKLIFGNLK